MMMMNIELIISPRTPEPSTNSPIRITDPIETMAGKSSFSKAEVGDQVMHPAHCNHGRSVGDEDKDSARSDTAIESTNAHVTNGGKVCASSTLELILQRLCRPDEPVSNRRRGRSDKESARQRVDHIGVSARRVDAEEEACFHPNRADPLEGESSVELTQTSQARQQRLLCSCLASYFEILHR